MKRKIVVFLAVVCIMLYCADISVMAEGYEYCPYCAAKLVEYGEHMGDWSNVRTFTDDNGKSVECREFGSVDKISRVCPVHMTVWSTTRETVTHSLPTCPYK